jgi:hypothetical protein
MAMPERESCDSSPPSTESERIARLAELGRQLELADENENPIERSLKRDELLEQIDELQGEIEISTPPPKLP